MLHENGTQRELGALEAKVDYLVRGQDALFSKVNIIERDLSALKVQARIWSTLTGAIGGALAALGFKISS